MSNADNSDVDDDADDDVDDHADDDVDDHADDDADELAHGWRHPRGGERAQRDNCP